jgi:hypothetical protein
VAIRELTDIQTPEEAQAIRSRVAECEGLLRRALVGALGAGAN